MYSAFEQAIRPYIPVVAHVKQKVALPARPPRPEVGIRWGNPSKFEHSNEAEKDREQGPIAVEYLGKKETLRGTEVYREYELVKTPYRPPDEPLSFKFERPVEMYFFTHEEERYSEIVKEAGGVRYIQPEITTVYHYVKFSFPLNNPKDEVISTGERGEHPDVTLANTQAEFDATLQGQMQKSKEHWEGVFENIGTWSQPSWVGGTGAD